MFGPNPVMPEGESKHGVVPHVKGLFYIGTSVNPQVALYKFNKKKPETANFDFTAYDTMYKAIVKTIGDYISGK